jgi:hypothetical protein
MRQPVPETVALARVLVGMADRDNEPAKLAIAHRALGYSLLIGGEFRAPEDGVRHGPDPRDVTDAKRERRA